MSFLKKLFSSKKTATTNMAAAATATGAKSTALGTWTPGAPVFSTVPPGSCQFGEEFATVALKSKVQISPDTYVFTFATPDETKPLNLPTCACILARTKAEDGTDIVRPYTPCSTNAMIGQFELMVKVYDDGKMTQHMKAMTPEGPGLEFKHISFNVKLQYPFQKRFVGMIVGGTGITPMIQALHALLGNKDDTTEVGLLYGSRTSDNILGKSTLDQWEKASSRLKVTHVLSAEPEGSDWTGSKGFITKSLIESHFPKPAEDVMIFVCGPPVMYNVFCGPREEKEEIKGLLGELGYTKDQVYKF